VGFGWARGNALHLESLYINQLHGTYEHYSMLNIVSMFFAVLFLTFVAVHYADAHALLYVVDGTDEARFAEAHRTLHEVLKHSQMHQCCCICVCVCVCIIHKLYPDVVLCRCVASYRKSIPILLVINKQDLGGASAAQVEREVGMGVRQLSTGGFTTQAMSALTG